jgi:hypothetical protein
VNRLEMEAIRNNINQRNLAAVANCTNPNNALTHHTHGTILFNTLNGGALSSASGNGGGNSLLHGSTDCFTGPDLVDSTTPPPTAISMPSASNASSSSSTISTNNVGLNRSSNIGSQDGVGMEKVKTPNSIRGKNSL